MADYDSSDDEMATRFEGISSSRSSSSIVEEECNFNVDSLPNNRDDNNNTFIAVPPAAAAVAATAPELVEQKQHDACSTIWKTQRPTTSSSSTRKRRHPLNVDDDSERTKRSAKASSTAAVAKPPLENASDRVDNEDEQTNVETHQISKEKPTHIRPSCRKCGRFDFTTATGAQRHEAACDGTKNPRGPWKCPTCGRDSFLTSQAFGGHYRCCNKVPWHQDGTGDVCVMLTPTCLSLGRAGNHGNDNDVDDGSSNTNTKSPRLEAARLKLSNFNQLILECIELFEASQSDVNVQVTGNGRRHITVGNVGIRCLHCARNNTLPIGSTSYTSDLKTLPHAMYVMVQRHLLVTCAHISNDMKRQLRETKKNSTSQSCTKGNIGLPAYLRLMAEVCGLTDDDKKLGVRLVAASTTRLTAVATEATAAAAAAAVREEEIGLPTVAAAAAAAATTDVAAPGEGGASAVSINHSLEDGEPTKLEMEHENEQPSCEPRPINRQDYTYYNPPFSSFLEEVTEEMEI